MLPARPNPRLHAAVADWRAFGASGYRPFRVLAVAQGFLGSLTGPAMTIPLLLALGAHPALATVLAVLPAALTMAQRWLPELLDRTDGNLRGIVILFATIGEPRGLYLAAVTAMAAAGWLPSGVAIALIGLICGVLGASLLIAYGINVLVRRQWADRERLTFPIIWLPLEMTQM